MHQYFVFAATYTWVQLGKEKSTHAFKQSINLEKTLCKVAILACSVHIFCVWLNTESICFTKSVLVLI